MAAWISSATFSGNVSFEGLYRRASAALHKAGRLPCAVNCPTRNSSGNRSWDQTREALARGKSRTTSGFAGGQNIAHFTEPTGGKPRRIWFAKPWTVGAGATAWFRVDQFGVSTVLRPAVAADHGQAEEEEEEEEDEEEDGNDAINDTPSTTTATLTMAPPKLLPPSSSVPWRTPKPRRGFWWRKCLASLGCRQGPVARLEMPSGTWSRGPTSGRTCTRRQRVDSPST